MEKKTSFVAVIMNCLGAVAWIILAVLDVAVGNPDYTAFVVHIFCATLGIFSAVFAILRYRKSKRNNE